MPVSSLRGTGEGTRYPTVIETHERVTDAYLALDAIATLGSHTVMLDPSLDGRTGWASG